MVERFAERRTRSATGGPGDEAREDRSCNAATNRADRPAKHTDGGAGFHTRQNRDCPACGACRGADGTANAACDVTLLASECPTRWTRPDEIAFARTKAR